MTTSYARFMITLALAIAAVFILGILYARADYTDWENWLGINGRAYYIIKEEPWEVKRTNPEDDSGEGMACYDDGSGCRPCKSDRECREGRGPRPVRFRPTQQVWQCNDLRVTVTQTAPFTWNYDIAGTIWGGINFTSDGPNLYLRGVPCIALHARPQFLR